MTGNIAAKLRHQRSLRHDELSEAAFDRDAELQDVIEDVEARLAKLRRITTPDVFEEELGAIEAVAAPYAIALLYEVRRLERLLRESSLFNSAQAGDARRGGRGIDVSTSNT